MRFYKNIYPKIDEIAIGVPIEISALGVRVKLIEYNDIEGFIGLREISERRVKSIRKVIKLNRQYPLLVVAVDAEKGYIDLSNKYISDRDSALEHYAEYKHVVSVYNDFIYRKGNISEEKKLDYADRILWRFGKGDAYREFSQIRVNLEKGMDQFDLDEEDKELLKSVVERLFKEPSYTIQMRFNLVVIEMDGVKRVKTLFRQLIGEEVEGCTMKITLLNSPMYQLEIVTKKKEEGVKLLERVKRVLEKLMEKERGTFSVSRTTCKNSSTDQEESLELEVVHEEDEEEDEEGEEDEDRVPVAVI